MFKKMLIAATLAATFNSAMANVVILGTRAVYPAGQQSINIQLDNVGSKAALVQSWLDKGDEHSSPDSVSSKVPFLITPPVTRINPNQSQTLRVVHTGEAMPQDRESIFYLNVLDIPPKPTESEVQGQNFLQMSIRSRIKFFYRPALAMKVTEAPEKVEWTLSGNQLIAKNPTPYYLTFSDVNAVVKGREVRVDRVEMVAPFSSITLPIKGAQGANSVKWQIINDYGGYQEGVTPLK